MKANELMIGDWVRHINGTPYQVTCIKDVHFACGIPHLWEYNNKFEPIPLTAEILEKNGFERYTTGFSRFIWQDVDGRTEITYNITYGDNMEIRKNIYYEDEECYVLPYVYFVHELQHALRLCGIDKEIVL